MQFSLEAHRVNAGLRQQDVADIMGVSRQTIINIETGKSSMKGMYIYAFAKLYGVEIDNIQVPQKNLQ